MQQLAVVVTLWRVECLFIVELSSSHVCIESRHYIVCISAGLQTFYTQFRFCEILRFYGDDY